MKEFKQAIPEGMQARVENGEVIYTPIDKCQFEVGDVVVWNNSNIRIYEGVDSYGFMVSSNYLKIKNDKFIITDKESYYNLKEYTKATQEQEALFNKKCLENGVWFDRVNKKWIELEDGGLYKVLLKNDITWLLILRKFENNGIFDYVSDEYCNLSPVFVSEKVLCHFKDVINISEATEEEKQKLFDELKEKGKRWNAEKVCVEDLRWVPEEFDRYMYYDAGRDKVSSTQHIDTSFDRHMVNIGNCFKTEAECGKYAEYMKECSKNYKQ